MAVLSLVENEKGDLFLHSTQPSRNAEFSIFDIDGEGSGSPFDLGNNTWVPVEGIAEWEYDPEDSDSFWDARQEIIRKCQAKGISLPDWVEVW